MERGLGNGMVRAIVYNVASLSPTHAHTPRELSQFIATGRLHCRIDKVGGIIETSR